MMDNETFAHFSRWLDRTVDPRDQTQVMQDIYKLVAEHPDLLERCSWPELRRMTESPR